MDHKQDFKLTILHWAEEDRPREKLLLKGKSVLSDAELIGILLGSGTKELNAVDLAKQILASAGHNLNALAKLSVKDLKKFKGIGEAKAITIVSALELGRRRKETESNKPALIKSSEDAHKQMIPYLLDKQTEEFWILILSRSNGIIKIQQISSGGVSGTVADPKVIFKYAIELLGSSIILVHNHPSGNLKPSESDIQLTKKLKAAGDTLELPVLDHIIFTDNGYFSFADEGIL